MNLIRKLLYRIPREVRRINSKLHAYDFPPESDGWKKYGQPVLGGKREGTFFDPYVIFKNNQFEMYVSHRDTDSIKKYSSDDGVHWTNGVTVLTGQKDCGWEERVNRASILEKDGLWYMWYTGQSKEKSMIGLAVSRDGIHFVRCEENPVLLPTEIYELQSVMNPCVIWDTSDKIFKMWYSAGEKYEPDVLCFATSIDGIHWRKYCNNPILKKSSHEYDKAKVGGCDVIKENGAYTMFYIGYQNVDNARICMAKSEDGVNWERLDTNPILAPSQKSWDSHAVYKPAVYFDEANKKCYLWYNGRNRNQESIGFAYRKGEL